MEHQLRTAGLKFKIEPCQEVDAGHEAILWSRVTVNARI
jgi:hypothetical protein